MLSVDGWHHGNLGPVPVELILAGGFGTSVWRESIETRQPKCGGRDGGCPRFLHPCPFPAVLQVVEYQGGPDRPGGVDGAGPVRCDQRCQCHAVVLPAVEEGAEVTQEARQCPAADVSTLTDPGMSGQGGSQL